MAVVQLKNVVPINSGPRLPVEPSRLTLERCKARDPEAFRQFVLAYQREIFALMARVAGPRAPVPDLAQEVFLRAYQAFPRFDLDGPAQAKTWLLTIAVRLALNARRQRARAPRAVPLADAPDFPEPSTPETERTRRELGRTIARAVDELSDDQRAAFVLAQFHGLSIAAIAAALGMPENTVKTRLFRARAQLREKLANLEEGGSR